MIEQLLKVNEIALLDTLCSAWRHQKSFDCIADSCIRRAAIFVIALNSEA